jgi:hypothetical protein
MACDDDRMSTVDPEDDGVARWVVHDYRYDPTRNERRNVVVAAFDNEQEFDLELAKRLAELRTEQAAGTRNGWERMSGVALPAGYRAETAREHAIKSAIRHGARNAAILNNSTGTVGFAILRATKEKYLARFS